MSSLFGQLDEDQEILDADIPRGRQYGRRQAHQEHVLAVAAERAAATGNQGAFPCLWRGCVEVFVMRGSLVQHVNSAHCGNARPWISQTCDWQNCWRSGKFTSQNHLICHLRAHTGERPYKCSVCKKRFSVRSNFNAHCRSRHPNTRVQLITIHFDKAIEHEEEDEDMEEGRVSDDMGGGLNDSGNILDTSQLLGYYQTAYGTKSMGRVQVGRKRGRPKRKIIQEYESTVQGEEDFDEDEYFYYFDQEMMDKSIDDDIQHRRRFQPKIINKSLKAENGGFKRKVGRPRSNLVNSKFAPNSPCNSIASSSSIGCIKNKTLNSSTSSISSLEDENMNKNLRDAWACVNDLRTKIAFVESVLSEYSRGFPEYFTLDENTIEKCNNDSDFEASLSVGQRIELQVRRKRPLLTADSIDMKSKLENSLKHFTDVVIPNLESNAKRRLLQDSPQPISEKPASPIDHSSLSTVSRIRSSSLSPPPLSVRSHPSSSPLSTVCSDSSPFIE